MSKITPEEKAAKKAEKLAKQEEKKRLTAEKKAAKKAAKEAKAAERKAKLEARKVKQLELKKRKKEKAKARLVAKKEKAKALKLKLKEKKQKAKEKERAKKMKLKERAQKAKEKAKVKEPKVEKNKKVDVFKNAIIISDTDKITLKQVVKTAKDTLKNIVNELATCDNIDKKVKEISKSGIEVIVDEGTITARLNLEIAKKLKVKKIKEPKKIEELKVEVKPTKKRGRKSKVEADEEPTPVEDTVVEIVEEPTSVETIPSGDLLNDNPEIPTILPDDESLPEDEDEFGNEDPIGDSRDETDDDLVESRREFFSQFGDDGEVNDNY